jgi:hypothetical protein
LLRRVVHPPQTVIGRRTRRAFDFIVRPLPAALVVEEHAACFVVRDTKGQALGYFYFERTRGELLLRKP